MQIQSNQSKPLLGLLPRWMHCRTSILFLMFLWRLYYIHISSELLLLCIILVISGCFACFLPQHVAARNLSAKGEVSFPLAWIGRLIVGGIISAVAEGCCEVVWHRHWLSLLRSEGIARLRKKRKERSEVSEQMNKTANWIGWDASVLWVSFIYLFHFFFWQHILLRLDQQSVMLF